MRLISLTTSISLAIAGASDDEAAEAPEPDAALLRRLDLQLGPQPLPGLAPHAAAPPRPALGDGGAGGLKRTGGQARPQAAAAEPKQRRRRVSSGGTGRKEGAAVELRAAAGHAALQQRLQLQQPQVGARAKPQTGEWMNRNQN